jgi:RNA polymerase sigma factor (sigma-70 family)
MVVSGATMSVDDSSQTRASLLVQIRDGTDRAAWQEFMKIYGPVVYGFARKRGLQDADAADLMQEVMRAVSASIGRLEYDPKQGTFRGWLFTITRNKVFTFLASRRNHPQSSGDSATIRLLDEQPDPNDSSEEWELEYQRRLASLAMARVKNEFHETSWQSFLLTAVEGLAPAEVARQIGISPGAVYVAKSRVLARIKAEVETMQRQEET